MTKSGKVGIFRELRKCQEKVLIREKSIDGPVSTQVSEHTEL